MTTHKSFLRSAGVISLLTLVSRILGLVRDALTAGILGAAGSITADAFVWAFTIPNMFRRLFGEGALSAAFIPVFVEYLGNDEKKDAHVLANVAITFMIMALSLIVVLGVVFCWVAVGHYDLSPKVTLTLTLLKTMLPYIGFICLYAMFMGILNSFKHFTMPAAGPAVFNICWILMVVFVVPQAPTVEQKAMLIALGVLIGGAVQMAIQIPMMWRNGLKFRIRFNWGHPGVRRVAKAMVPVVLGLAVFQINTLLDATFAEIFIVRGKDHGAVSILYYANRLMQFPLGVFGIAIATAVFPTLAEHAARKNRRALVDTMGEALRVSFFIALPATVGLIVLREPIIALLFERGAFTAESTFRTGLATAYLTAGLFAFCGMHIVSRTFYALGDTKTPLKIGVGVVVLNLGLNLAFLNLFPGLKEAALALATSVSTVVNLFVSALLLRRKLGMLNGRRIVTSFVSIAAVSVVMGVVCQAVVMAMPGADTFVDKMLRVAFPITAGMAVFFGLARFFGLPELKTLLYVYLPRKKKASDADVD